MYYDVAVVGGGPAGTHMAMSVAKHSKQGLKVLLIDRNPRQEFAKKTLSGWSCGDAVSKRSIDYVQRNLGIEYRYPELEHYVKGVVAYSPNHETKVLFEGEGYVLNRKFWPQRQLEFLEKFGVEVMFEAAARRLTAEDGFIVGVEGTRKDGSVFKVRAKVVVDASGSASILRANLPIKSFIERQINLDDMESTGRYILEFDQNGEDKTYFDPDYCLIHLDQYLAPGGYAWNFPKGPNKVNIGLGVQKRALELRNRRFKENDSLRTLIDEYVRLNPVIRNPRPADGPLDTGNEYNTWQVPVRRQNDCLVSNGYAIVGDAAWMPRPIDAGGIGPALYASIILGRIVAEAVEEGDTSEAGLWRYNLEYMAGYGSQMASFEVLRRFLQNVTNEEIDYGMKHFLSYEDVEKITLREHPGFRRLKLFNPLMLFRILTHWSLASGLRYAVHKHRLLLSLYSEYPEKPAVFPAWHRRFLKELREAYKRFP